MDLATLQADLDEWLMYYKRIKEKCAVAEHRWKDYLMENGFGRKSI